MFRKSSKYPQVEKCIEKNAILVLNIIMKCGPGFARQAGKLCATCKIPGKDKTCNSVPGVNKKGDSIKGRHYWFTQALTYITCAF
jgi:hypothetical protein